MTIFEIIVVLAASPIIAALLYGAWQFSGQEDSAGGASARDGGPTKA